ncbi:hypothetical protein MATL_G00134440 [Megalops atlanticus]|uniref:Uncharacterized protein n=1 Tax=Megalops atlanticus TaxID=7932 RepID=A0A9D3T484_MEGAT|nr:hypothetical protein MATL_G00134440 [Megalops atlanticus]
MKLEAIGAPSLHEISPNIARGLFRTTPERSDRVSSMGLGASFKLHRGRPVTRSTSAGQASGTRPATTRARPPLSGARHSGPLCLVAALTPCVGLVCISSDPAHPTVRTPRGSALWIRTCSVTD